MERVIIIVAIWRLRGAEGVVIRVARWRGWGHVVIRVARRNEPDVYLLNSKLDGRSII